MSDSPTQKGTAYKIGFGSLAWRAYLIEDGMEAASPRELDEVPDMNNSVVSILVSRPTRVFRTQWKIQDGPDPLDTGSILDATFADGAAITITDQNNVSVAAKCRNAKIRFARKHTLLDVELTYYPNL